MFYSEIYRSKIKRIPSVIKYIRNVFIFSLISIPVLSLPTTSRSFIENNPKEVLDEVWQIIYRDYLDSSGSYNVDEWISIRKRLLSNKYAGSEDAYVSIREMLSSLKDPYTRFLDPQEFNEMKIETAGELMGVGIQISLDSENNKLVVISPIEGTPAFNAGIQPNDVIISIDGELTEGMSIEKAVKLIRGERGTRVVLGILRGENFLKVSIKRDRIEINSVNSRLNSRDNGLKIGYIRLKQFNANASKEMKNTIRKLEKNKASGYVLDLRGNPGGLLESSIDIARQWIDQGTIVSTKTRDGINDVRKANGSALTRKPLVVLVNEGSASASEILSGAIRDNARGILVGKKTFGKGLVQSVRALSDGSGLTVTIAKYLTPKGTDINKNGIVPDIEAEISLNQGKRFNQFDLGTIKDSQYLVAESALIKQINRQKKKTTYEPGKSNLKFALKRTY